MAKKKMAKLKSVKRKISKPRRKQEQRAGGKNLHVEKLQKKLRKISAHIKKCREDLQSIIRLKQIQSQIGGK